MAARKDKTRRAKKRCHVTAAVAAIIAPCGVSGADTDLSDWVKKNLADDHAECAAYFFVIANAPGVPDSTTTKYKTMYELALNRSINLGGEKRAVAAYKLSAESMLRTIKQEEDDGLMLLMEEHAFHCKDLMEDPQSHIEKLQRQED